MNNKKGYVTENRILIIILIIIMAFIPIACHQIIVRKQAIMAKTGVEMSYWDVFWTEPQLIYTQGEIIVED